MSHRYLTPVFSLEGMVIFFSLGNHLKQFLVTSSSVSGRMISLTALFSHIHLENYTLLHHFAITEAAVGAGVTSILFFATLKKIHAIQIEKEKSSQLEETKEEGGEHE